MFNAINKIVKVYMIMVSRKLDQPNEKYADPVGFVLQ